ncbi:MAG: sigma-54-dependent Fis family transcriptional regulator [Thauera sp.]|nr:sigma-54-dependent Fis family transcriptional regulator [Thauera sp.]
MSGQQAELSEFGLLGQSPAFVAAMKLMRRFAETSAHVLIQGETGTGKELVARAIHYLGTHRYQPFVPVNCGALPDNLMENELFGHARGAFTDARDSQPGLIGSAEGGTLFLDEIECLSMKGQVALLRFLQDGRYRQLGAQSDRRADVRVIAASNQDFAELVRAGRFRQDLYYRLAIMAVDLPPLRQRGGDILLLIEHFLARFAREYRRTVPQLDPSSARAALAHDWPGNVRELENLVHRQFLLAEGDVVRLDDALEPASTTCADEEHAVWSLDFTGMDMKLAKAEVIARFERDYLKQAIALTRGNVSLAAQHAGKERRAFGKLLKKYGIDRSRY